MNKFALKKQPVTIIKTNPRPEAIGEDLAGRLASDIKVLVEGIETADIRALVPTAPGSESVSLVDALHREEGKIRFHGISTLSLGAEYEKAEITIGDLSFEAAKLNKFRIIAVKDGGKCDLTFRIQVYPTEEQSGQLDAMQRKTVALTISPQPELEFGPAKKAEDKQADLSLH